MPEGKGKGSAVRKLGVSTAKGTLIYLAGNMIGSLAILLLLAILARLLSPAAFGLYAIAIAFYTILTGHFTFGVILRKEVPGMTEREKIRELMGGAYAVALIVGLAIAMAAVLLSGPIATYIYHDASFAPSLMLAGALVFLYTFFNLMLASLVAMGRVKYGTIIYLSYAFIQLVASTALVLMGYGVFGAIAGLGAGLLVPSLLGLYWVVRHAGRPSKPSRETMRHVVGFTSPLIASSIANQAPPNLAILLLGVFATTTVVGNYNAAFKFGNFVNVILLAVSYVLLPAFSRSFTDKRLSSKIGKIYNSSIYYTLLLLLPVVVYAVSVSQPLVLALFSSEYTMAPLYFALIAIGTTVGMLNTYASNLQIGYGDTRRFMKYQLAAALIQVALLGALVPYLGAIGAILALFIVSQIAINFLYIWALDRQFSLRHSFGGPARLAAASAVLLALLYGVTLLLQGSYWAILTNIVITVALFPPLAALFGAVRKWNLDFVNEVAHEIRLGKLGDYITGYAALFVKA